MKPSQVLTRRRFGLLLSGGLVAAAVAGDTLPLGRRGPLNGRRPDRVAALPLADTAGTLALEAALARRHSVRQFPARAVPEDVIAQLLWAGQGVTRTWGGRTAPSAGALYPLDLYVVQRDRLWHYLPKGHRIEEWAVDDLRPRLHDAVRDAPVVLVVTGTVSRTARKYAGRADRYVALEAGHCAQNVLLEVTALGLGAVPIGSVSGSTVRHVLGLASGTTTYYLIPVG